MEKEAFNPQRVVDEVVKGLASQGFERSYEGRGCVYNDAHGRHCAAGWLMDQNKGKPWESFDVTKDEVARCLYGWATPEEPYTGNGDQPQWELLIDLQRAHDTGKTPDSMKVLLANAIARHNLNVPGLLDLNVPSSLNE